MKKSILVLVVACFSQPVFAQKQLKWPSKLFKDIKLTTSPLSERRGGEVARLNRDNSGIILAGYLDFFNQLKDQGRCQFSVLSRTDRKGKAYLELSIDVKGNKGAEKRVENFYAEDFVFHPSNYEKSDDETTWVARPSAIGDNGENGIVNNATLHFGMRADDDIDSYTQSGYFDMVSRRHDGTAASKKVSFVFPIDKGTHNISAAPRFKILEITERRKKLVDAFNLDKKAAERALNEFKKGLPATERVRTSSINCQDHLAQIRSSNPQFKDLFICSPSLEVEASVDNRLKNAKPSLFDEVDCAAKEVEESAAPSNPRRSGGI